TVGNDTEVVVELDPEEPFDVMVTTSAGQPVPDAEVSVRSLGGSPRPSRLPIPCGRTDAEGRLSVERAPSGRAVVRATHPEYGATERTTELPTALLHLELQASGALEGVLSEGGRPPMPGRWQLAVRPAGRPALHGIDLPQLTRPAPDGGFRLSGLVPGDYEVSVVESSVSAPLDLVLDLAGVAERLRSRTRRCEITVHAGRTTHLDIDTEQEPAGAGVPAARVSGTLMLNGKPGLGLDVR